jgi:hypothetical protein
MLLLQLRAVERVKSQCLAAASRWVLDDGVDRTMATPSSNRSRAVLLL